MDPLGFEPRASSLQRRHSPTELWAHPSITRGSSLDSSKVPDRPRTAIARKRTKWAGAAPQSRSVEVIQPQIPLRLPCYDLSPLAKPRFDCHTGSLIRTSLGCFDGRCVQGAGTYSPRSSEARLLPNPASCGRVSVRNPNYDRVSEISAPSRGGIPLSRPL